MLAAVFCVAGFLLPASAPALAAPMKGYEAMTVSVTSKIRMKPGETKTVSAEFLNLGPETWLKDGANFVSIYTREPNYRTSVFENAGWYKPGQPAKITETKVEKSKKGTISFVLKAPSKIGSYREPFQLAAEDKTWIPGSAFALQIEVSNDVASSVPSSSLSSSPAVPSPSKPSQPSAPTGLSALVLIRSAKNVTARGGESIPFRVGIKNTGTATWKKREIRLPEVNVANFKPIETKDSTWASATQAAVVASGEVAPGSLDFIDFTFRAPSRAGRHSVQFAFAADGQVVPDFFIEIPVDVTSDSGEVFNSPVRNDLPQQTFYQMDQIDEPLVRVGVLIVDEETDNKVEVLCESPWQLRDERGELLAEMKAGESVWASYRSGRYRYDRGMGTEKTNFALRFVPNAPNSICRIDNFDRRVTRKFTYPDNEFRNVLEMRYNADKDRTWMINELPIEYYLRGLAETSNVSPMEYQKSLIIAARTYAFYHWTRATKHATEGFHLSSSADDQVYNGYGQEKRAPRITEAVKATEGQVVTYNGELAITPYFSRSDGRTRAWGEVWNGSVPWLDRSVECPCDKSKGFALWGHGVGMSANEALCMANNGQSYDQILKYFYQGIQLGKKWVAKP
ncbi:SpoIID/LytB domain-containing protein [Candidatus Uhrbacteria bacterium]|nr:SpoIID/LytB domain-containing protein [Candidatus Uhrbacteria bacterium]